MQSNIDTPLRLDQTEIAAVIASAMDQFPDNEVVKGAALAVIAHINGPALAALDPSRPSPQNREALQRSNDSVFKAALEALQHDLKRQMAIAKEECNRAEALQRSNAEMREALGLIARSPHISTGAMRGIARKALSHSSETDDEV